MARCALETATTKLHVPLTDSLKTRREFLFYKVRKDVMFNGFVVCSRDPWYMSNSPLTCRHVLADKTNRPVRTAS